ncbi:hypothetical protein ACFFHH_13650 [Cytobacillus solani]|uniref:hypothetical protein n=1 Tax=Cytobacillus solani TaxID=1637975 RepID=UPI001154334A|nr:hypothetical protein [Cytobacillus solani]
MGTRVHYPEEIKWKVIELKQKGVNNHTIMDQLGINNISQTHPVGKQYTYGKGPDGLSEVEELRRRNKQLETQLEILKKYQEIERRWSRR